jgi:hypothetical protein
MFHYDAVVPPDVSVEKVREALRERGARKIGDIPRGELQLGEEVWEHDDGDRVRIVDDHFVDITSVRAESSISGQPADLVFALQPELGLQDIDDLIALGRSSEIRHLSHAIRGLAAIADGYGSDIVETISSGLGHEDPALREAALRAIARWPHFAFVRELEAMSESEPDPALRQEARQLAEDVRQHGRRGTS